MANRSLFLGRPHPCQEGAGPSGQWVSAACPLFAQGKCCGWVSFYNWTDNAELMNRTNVTFPCSCEDKRDDDSPLLRKGFCELPAGNRTESGNSPEAWPVYQEVSGGLWGRAGFGDARGFKVKSHAGSPGLRPLPPSLLLAVPAFDPCIPLSLVPSSYIH